MEKEYWIGGKRSPLAMAPAATSAEARLAHDLADRRNVQAANCAAFSVPQASISEAQITDLIPHFYERVRQDELIGPLFDDAISDWQLHLDKLVAFWSSVMLTSGRYKGNPVAAHMKHLEAITPPMFDRWLELWAEVTTEVLPPAPAVALQNKAGRIAESLKLALYFRLAPPASSSSASIDATHAKD